MLINFLEILEIVERKQGMTGTTVAILLLAITTILALSIVCLVGIGWLEVVKWALNIIIKY